MGGVTSETGQSQEQRELTHRLRGLKTRHKGLATNLRPPIEALYPTLYQLLSPYAAEARDALVDLMRHGNHEATRLNAAKYIILWGTLDPEHEESHARVLAASIKLVWGDQPRVQAGSVVDVRVLPEG